VSPKALTEFRLSVKLTEFTVLYFHFTTRNNLPLLCVINIRNISRNKQAATLQENHKKQALQSYMILCRRITWKGWNLSLHSVGSCNEVTTAGSSHSWSIPLLKAWKMRSQYESMLSSDFLMSFPGLLWKCGAAPPAKRQEQLWKPAQADLIRSNSENEEQVSV